MFALEHLEDGRKEIFELLDLHPEGLIFRPYLLIDRDLVDDLPVHQPDIFGEILHDWDVAVLNGSNHACHKHILGLNSFNSFLHKFVLRSKALKKREFLFFLLLLLGRSGNRYGELTSSNLVRESLDAVFNGSQLKTIEGLLVLLREIGEDFTPR